MQVFNCRALKGTVIIAAAAMVALGPGAVRGQASGPFAYVANRFSDNVSVIDTSTDTVVATVPVDVSMTETLPSGPTATEAT